MRESVPPRPELRLETTEEAHARIGSTGHHRSREERNKDRQIARASEVESARTKRNAPVLAQFPDNLALEQQAIAAGTWRPEGSFFGRLSESRGNSITDPVSRQALATYTDLLNLNDASRREREFENLVQTELALAQKGKWNRSNSRIHILHITDRSGDKDYDAKLDKTLASLAKTNSDAIERQLAVIERVRRRLEN